MIFDQVSVEPLLLFLKDASAIEDGEFTKDGDISDLLVFPANTDFHKFVLYREGKIFLQDKVN